MSMISVLFCLPMTSICHIPANTCADPATSARILPRAIAFRIRSGRSAPLRTMDLQASDGAARQASAVATRAVPELLAARVHIARVDAHCRRPFRPQGICAKRIRAKSGPKVRVLSFELFNRFRESRFRRENSPNLNRWDSNGPSASTFGLRHSHRIPHRHTAPGSTGHCRRRNSCGVRNLAMDKILHLAKFWPLHSQKVGAKVKSLKWHQPARMAHIPAPLGPHRLHNSAEVVHATDVGHRWFVNICCQSGNCGFCRGWRTPLKHTMRFIWSSLVQRSSLCRSCTFD